MVLLIILVRRADLSLFFKGLFLGHRDRSRYGDQKIHDIYLAKTYYIIVTSIAAISNRKTKEMHSYQNV